MAPGFVEARLLGTGPCWDWCFRVVLGGDAGPVRGCELGWWDEADLPVRQAVVRHDD